MITSVCPVANVTLSVKLGTGNVLSNKYVPLHAHAFPAQSIAHKYNILDHSVLSVITVPFVYVVHAAVQSAALVQLYLAQVILVSVPDNVIGMFEVNHTPVLLAITTGAIVSYVVGIVFDTMFPFVAKSFATHAHTFTLTAHCAVGFTVQL